MGKWKVTVNRYKAFGQFRARIVDSAGRDCIFCAFESLPAARRELARLIRNMEGPVRVIGSWQ